MVCVRVWGPETLDLIWLLLVLGLRLVVLRVVLGLIRLESILLHIMAVLWLPLVGMRNRIRVVVQATACGSAKG